MIAQQAEDAIIGAAIDRKSEGVWHPFALSVYGECITRERFRRQI